MLRTIAALSVPAALALGCAALLSAGFGRADLGAAYDLRLSYGGNVYVMDHDLTADDCRTAERLNTRYASKGHTWTCVPTLEP